VAPGANIINVKVLCNGSSSKTLIRALNDVSNEHNANRKNQKGWDFRGSVINMFVLLRTTKSSFGLLNLLGPLVITAGNWESATPWDGLARMASIWWALQETTTKILPTIGLGK
jgi:hypothetical protein